MRTIFISALCAVPAVAAAQEHRQLGSHEHGVSTVEIAVDGDRMVIDLYAPGADIVGFEYAAQSDDDRDAIAKAVLQLSRPQDIVAFPDAAGCRLTEVLSHLHTGEGDHDTADDHSGEGGHEDHAEGEDHDEHAEEGGSHSEFHARYAFACTAPDSLTEIAFPFFKTFSNAVEIEAQYATASGAGRSEITRDAASLTLD